MRPRIRTIETFVVQPSPPGTDAPEHWIERDIATPMWRYSEFRQNRSSWGKDVLGQFAVVTQDDEGHVGWAIGTGGVAAALLVEQALRPLIIGQPVGALDACWDRMTRATQHWGRKGLAMMAIGVLDLALWDLYGKARDEPVYELLGCSNPPELRCYATGPDPARAKELGFDGAKVPFMVGGVQAGADGDAELRRLAGLRDAVGSGFPLMLDCWMSLHRARARQLRWNLDDLRYLWIEEPLDPDDYTGYAQLVGEPCPHTLVATGEHEAGVAGFATLLGGGCLHIAQPDVSWCGGLTALLRIATLARSFGIPVIPHASSVYAYHMLVTDPPPYPVEFIMRHPTGADVVPSLGAVVSGEPLPERGRVRLGNEPGFGIRPADKDAFLKPRVVHEPAASSAAAELVAAL